MLVLEQILEEIEKAEGKWCNAEHSPTFCMGAWSMASDIKDIIRSHMDNEPVSNTGKLDDGWIPAEYPPETNDCILLSFSNYPMPLIGRYKADGNGGAFYLGDCDGDDTCIGNDLYVNAWQPLPKPYRPKED